MYPGGGVGASNKDGGCHGFGRAVFARLSADRGARSEAVFLSTIFISFKL